MINLSKMDREIKKSWGIFLLVFLTSCHSVTSAKVVVIECLSELSAWLSTFLKLSILAFNLLFSHRNMKSPFFKLPRETGGEKCRLSLAHSKTLQDNRKTRIFHPLTFWPCKLMAFCCKYINKRGPMWDSNPGSKVFVITGNSVLVAPYWHLIHLHVRASLPQKLARKYIYYPCRVISKDTHKET